MNVPLQLGTEETLRKQYWQVKEETKTSHVMHYGNLVYLA